MKYIVTLTVCFFLVGCGGVKRHFQEPVAHIRPTHEWEIESIGLEHAGPSGIIRLNGVFYIVSDKGHTPIIYKLSRATDKKFVMRPAIRIFTTLNQEFYDFEGLTYCNDTFYIIEERSSTVWAVNKDGASRTIGVDINPLHESNWAYVPGRANEGFEGVACDGTTLYLAKERQFRMIYMMNLEDLTISDFFDVPAGWDSPRFDRGYMVFPDYTDLYYEAGFLYALQRSDHRVLKLDPKTKTLAQWITYAIDEESLYNIPGIFGMAEGLYMDQSNIYILLDNNGHTRRRDPTNTNAMLFRFNRPLNF